MKIAFLWRLIISFGVSLLASCARQSEEVVSERSRAPVSPPKIETKVEDLGPSEETVLQLVKGGGWKNPRVIAKGDTLVSEGEKQVPIGAALYPRKVTITNTGGGGYINGVFYPPPGDYTEVAYFYQDEFHQWAYYWRTRPF